MDWLPIPFEPNLKFALELSEDLKTKYFQQHEKAKKTLERFSCSLKNVFHEHQKVLADNIELSINNERLKQIISKHESNNQQNSIITAKPSQILASSKNCQAGNSSKIINVDKKVDRLIKDDEKIKQKENIEYVPIFSSDFSSDIEDDDFRNYKSPPQSAINTPVKNKSSQSMINTPIKNKSSAKAIISTPIKNESSPKAIISTPIKNKSSPQYIIHTPVKVQNSPILSKRKRSSSKKSNSSISNVSAHSIPSSNDSKVDSIHSATLLDKNIFEIENNIKQEIEKEPLKTIENIFTSTISSSQDKNKDQKLLQVSKTNYGKTEFVNKGKRLRQTTLFAKKKIPTIDISKIESNESFYTKNDTKLLNSEIFFDQKINKKEKSNNNVTSLKAPSKKKNLSLELPSTSTYQNTSKDDDLIETSPAQSEKSKLRNKLSLHKKAESSKIKVKNPSSINKDIIKKQKSFEPQRTFSDDTYFSPAESYNNMDDNMEITEEETKYETPPSKRMLLNSFDIIPGREEKRPNYAYKEQGVRKKHERAQLQGWGCRDCVNYYNMLPEDQRKDRQNLCSKHRGNYKTDLNTPESFWNPVFDNTDFSSSIDDY